MWIKGNALDSSCLGRFCKSTELSCLREMQFQFRYHSIIIN